jgi:hypothetical protein
MRRFLLVAAASALPAVASAQTPAAAAPAYVPAPASTLPIKRQAEPTSADISAKDLMSRLYVFADDSMMGRETGTEGNFKGTEYIAAEVKRIGLQPAGENGTYFQTLPFKTRSVDSTSTVTAGGTPLAYGTEWAATGTASLARPSIQTVYGGVLGDTTVRLTPEQINGKAVLFTMPADGRISLGARPPEGAAATIVVLPANFLGFMRRPSTFVHTPAADAPKPQTIIAVTPASAPKLFDRPLEQLKPGDAGKTLAVDVRIGAEPVKFPARNVVAILPGSDPALKAQYVAIGAHNDHVGVGSRPVDHDSMRIFMHVVRPGGAEDSGKRPTPEQMTQVNTMLAAWRSAHPGTSRLDSISNGADDDGSGSVTVLEMAERLAASRTKPKRSIIFVWHTGEEKGLLGAAYFTANPTVPRDSIVAQLNMDMVGRGNAWDVTGATKDGAPLRGNDNYLQLVGSRRLSTELGDLIEKTNADGKYGFRFDYAMDANGHPMNIYCRSDHYEYAKYGIPITFFTTGGHSDYHQVTDEPQYIDYDHMATVGRLVSDIALRVANLDHRVVVDQPKPDPNAQCQQ